MNKNDELPEPVLFVGIDWGTKEHVCFAVAADGARRWLMRINHDPADYRRLVDRILKTCPDPQQVAVAIEDPRHALVDWLLDHQMQVYSLNPKQLDRFRDRYNVAGAKDDELDSWVLGDSLRNDRHLFSKLQIPSPAVIAVREAFRRHEIFQKELRRDTSRLQTYLQRTAPNLLALCPAADEPFFFELLALAPSTLAARRLRPARIENLLARHDKRKFNASQVLEILRAPRLQLAPGAEKSIWETVLALLPVLTVTQQQLKASRKQLKELSANAGRDAEVIDSFPGAAEYVVCAFLAEASQAIASRNLQQLRALAGTAPVTRRSGRSHQVLMRRACHSRLRNGCQHWASNAIIRDPAARALYDALRGRGLGYHRALRGVADRLLARLVAALNADALYRAPVPVNDPSVT